MSTSKKPVVRKVIDFIAKSKKIFVGLEDSKSTWKLCVRSDREIIADRVSMSANYDVLRSYFVRNFPDCDIHVAYEAGFKGFNLYFSLVSDGYTCTVVPPHTVLQAKCSRVKTDHSDARLLAKHLEDGNCAACHVPDPERLADRQVVRSLNIVNRDIKRVKNQIRGFLKFHGLEPATVGGWNNGHYRRLRALDRISPTLRKLLDLHLDQLEHCLAQRKELEGMLRDLSKKERYARAVKIARSFPGIGWLTAIRLVLELGEDLHRFRSGGEIASFVGLGGSEHSTGETERRGGITKQGNSMVRSWLIESAWTARKHDAAMQRFFAQVKHNTAMSKKAVVAVARKLIVRLRSCIINDTEYVFGVIQ